MNFDFDPKEFIHNPFAVGGLGSIVSLKFAPGATWLERAFNVLCGVLMAGFLAVALAEFFSLTSEAMRGAIAFLIGVFGMNLVATVVVWIREMKLSDVVPWFRRTPKE
jgi:CBS-domain-containing membrane protein